MMQTVRLSCLPPTPLALAAYDLGPVLASQRYRSRTFSLTPSDFQQLLERCRAAFLHGATVGVCDVKPVKAIFFDMDATAIAEESLVELARTVDKHLEVAAITKRAMDGDLDYKAALVARVALLAGLSASILPIVYARLTINPGLPHFLNLCRLRGVKTYLISGGFMQLAQPLQRQLGFTGVHANTLEEQSGCLTGHLSGAIVDAEEKRTFLLKTCRDLGISPQEVAAVGDGANDLLMLKAAGVAVGYKPKAILLEHLHAQNVQGDHRFLAPLLFGVDADFID